VIVEETECHKAPKTWVPSVLPSPHWSSMSAGTPRLRCDWRGPHIRTASRRVPSSCQHCRGDAMNGQKSGPKNLAQSTCACTCMQVGVGRSLGSGPAQTVHPPQKGVMWPLQALNAWNGTQSLVVRHYRAKLPPSWLAFECQGPLQSEWPSGNARFALGHHRTTTFSISTAASCCCTAKVQWWRFRKAFPGC